MNCNVYYVPPLDDGWDFLLTVAEVAERLEEDDLGVFLSDWAVAKHEAREKGWEGDFRQDPCVFWLPWEREFLYGFVFKQDNNGLTFVVSPKPLVYLEGLAID